MNKLLLNAVVAGSIIGVGYSLVLGDELFALSFLTDLLFALSLYADEKEAKGE